MDRFTENLTEGLRRFAMAGVGAVVLTVDKSKEIIDKLVERGEASAAEGRFACDDLQKKMTEQLNAFTQKLKADYESSSFEQLITRCQKLSPEQKAQLVDLLTRQPECGPDQAPEESFNESPDRDLSSAEETCDAPETIPESGEPAPGEDSEAITSVDESVSENDGPKEAILAAPELDSAETD